MAPGPLPLSQPMDVDSLRQAVDVYLRIAYEDKEPSPAVKRRLEWTPGSPLTDLLNAPPFERAGTSRDGMSLIYALRLGNALYPHMKLQVQTWVCPSGYLLSVNTHDQVLALDPNSIDAGGFKAIQMENARLKEAIENAWDTEGFPTFLQYLRKFLDDQASGEVPPIQPI